MDFAQLDPARIQAARQVDTLVGQMIGELETAANPHRLALSQLGMDSWGTTKVPYKDEAFEIWNDLIKRAPDDFEALHHLAIMHHARAFDLEIDKEPAKSNDDWEIALKYWHRLWQMDTFWNRIADIACKGTKRDPVDALRTKFPQLLLRVHYDVALDPITKNHRTRYHLGLVAKSPFPVEFQKAAQSETYKTIIGRVPNHVWNADVLDPQVVKLGTDVIKWYLERDPSCTAALEDALVLQDRVLDALYADLMAEGENSPKKNGLLRRISDAGNEWRPYFDQLVQIAPQLTAEGVRSKLCLWYRVIGDVLCGLDKEADAIPFYEQGAKAGPDGDVQRARCVRKVGETYAYVAREKAHSKSGDAKTYCDQIRKRSDLSVTAHFWLATAYMRLHEFRLAREVCTKGQQVQLEESETDFDVIKTHDEGLQRLRDQEKSIQVNQLCTQAIDLMKSDNGAAAMKLLNEAAALAPDEESIYFLRSQCHHSLGLRSEARADLEKYKNLAGHDPDSQTAIKQLERLIAGR